jgi:hypothetical protein
VLSQREGRRRRQRIRGKSPERRDRFVVAACREMHLPPVASEIGWETSSMNALYHANKIVGVAFALGLAGFAGYRAYEWRNDMSRDLHKEAQRRLNRRLTELSEQSAIQFDQKSIWETMKVPGDWQGKPLFPTSARQPTRL